MGDQWDDGIFDGIRKITLSHSENVAIGFFQVTYDVNGKESEGPTHGSSPDNSYTIVPIEFPSEYITGVSGFTGPLPGGDNKNAVVLSLKFDTSQGKPYGPYGAKTIPANGNNFDLKVDSGFRIVGFKGVCENNRLKSLDIHKAKP